MSIKTPILPAVLVSGQHFTIENKGEEPLVVTAVEGGAVYLPESDTFIRSGARLTWRQRLTGVA